MAIDLNRAREEVRDEPWRLPADREQNQHAKGLFDSAFAQRPETQEPAPDDPQKPGVQAVAQRAQLMARAVADGRGTAAQSIGERAAVIQSLQRSLGNGYVQRMVDRAGPARLVHQRASPGFHSLAPLGLQLQTEEDEDAGMQFSASALGLGFSTPPATPSGAPNGNGGAPAAPPANGGLPPAAPPAAGNGASAAILGAAANGNGASANGHSAGNGSNGSNGHSPAVSRISLPPDEAREKHGSTGAGAVGPDPAQPQQAPPGAAQPGAPEQQPAGPSTPGDQASANAGGGGAAEAGASPPAEAGAPPAAAGAPPAAPTGTPGAAGSPPAAPGAPGSAAAPEAAPAGDAAAKAEAITAEEMNEETAQLVADFAESFGGQSGDVKGPAAALLKPEMRQAAARLLPDRAPGLLDQEMPLAPEAEKPAAEPAAGIQRSPLKIQRQGKGTGTLPTMKVKVTLPDWPKSPLFKDKNLGSWFLLSGEVESPTWEGEAKPPDTLRDDTKEAELQMTADGKLKGYTATLWKDTLGKAGPAEIEGKVAVETTTEGVKVTGLTIKLPDLGGQSAVLFQGEMDFSLLDWKTGELPELLVLSYTQKIGVKSSFTEGGWAFSGSLYLPVKFSIKPNPAKLAEWVARMVGPRLAAAAPAGLAIGAPLVAGGVCLALWINAIQAGEDMAKAMDMAKQNTIGYVTAYFNTIMGYTSQRYPGKGADAGTAAAQKVLDDLRWSELPAGAHEKIRAEYIKDGTLDLPGVQASIWSSYRQQAIDWYRKEHSWDAWAYDHGLPSDQGDLQKGLDIIGPPWPVSAY